MNCFFIDKLFNLFTIGEYVIHNVSNEHVILPFDRHLLYVANSERLKHIDQKSTYETSKISFIFNGDLWLISKSHPLSTSNNGSHATRFIEGFPSWFFSIYPHYHFVCGNKHYTFRKSSGSGSTMLWIKKIVTSIEFIVWKWKGVYGHNRLNSVGFPVSDPRFASPGAFSISLPFYILFDFGPRDYIQVHELQNGKKIYD